LRQQKNKGRVSSSNAYNDDSEVLVFATGLEDHSELPLVERILKEFSDIVTWSVDLEDWERVLRVVCRQTQPDEIIVALSNHGVFVREMD